MGKVRDAAEGCLVRLACGALYGVGGLLTGECIGLMTYPLFAPLVDGPIRQYKESALLSCQRLVQTDFHEDFAFGCAIVFGLAGIIMGLCLREKKPEEYNPNPTQEELDQQYEDMGHP